jgi:hypothetical protein
MSFRVPKIDDFAAVNLATPLSAARERKVPYQSTADR